MGAVRDTTRDDQIAQRSFGGIVDRLAAVDKKELPLRLCPADAFFVAIVAQEKPINYFSCCFNPDAKDKPVPRLPHA